MVPMKSLAVTLAVALAMLTGIAQSNPLPSITQKGEQSWTTAVLKSAGGLSIKADIYQPKKSNSNSPVVLMFHQAGYSRGEYRPIAPTLSEKGFICISIDQRSGKEVNGVTNEANREAQRLKLGTSYVDALADLETALHYAQQEYKGHPIVVWGSSYSASLSVVLVSLHPKTISALVLFSPGEYFTYRGKAIEHYAKSVRCPVFITSAKDEHDAWKKIFDAISSEQKEYLVPQEMGVHGSKALWKENPNSAEYWNALLKFLHGVK